jgi:ABC-type nitrate/sulfonate/bicarbonate transport system ATPase subunit
VMSKRPSRIIENIPVPMPRPRSIELQESVQFMQLRARVRKLIQN